MQMLSGLELPFTEALLSALPVNKGVKKVVQKSFLVSLEASV